MHLWSTLITISIEIESTHHKVSYIGQAVTSMRISTLVVQVISALIGIWITGSAVVSQFYHLSSLCLFVFFNNPLNFCFSLLLHATV